MYFQHLVRTWFFGWTMLLSDSRTLRTAGVWGSLSTPYKGFKLVTLQMMDLQLALLFSSWVLRWGITLAPCHGQLWSLPLVYSARVKVQVAQCQCWDRTWTGWGDTRRKQEGGNRDLERNREDGEAEDCRKTSETENTVDLEEYRYLKEAGGKRRWGKYRSEIKENLRYLRKENRCNGVKAEGERMEASWEIVKRSTWNNVGQLQRKYC